MPALEVSPHLEDKAKSTNHNEMMFQTMGITFLYLSILVGTLSVPTCAANLIYIC